MKQSLNSFLITPLNGNPVAVKARLAADVPFTASTGEVHPAGNSQTNYVEYLLTVSGDGRLFPTANGIDSTTDSSDPNATYTLYLLDANNKEIGAQFERWIFDASLGASILYSELESRNTHKVPLRDDQVYTKMQVDNLLLNRTFASPATLADFGVVKISGPSSTVVSTDDPRVAADQAANAASIRTLGTGAQQAAPGNDSRIIGAAQKANNLSDLASASTARTNLGLGNIATHNTNEFLQPGNNLGDVANVSLARTNLGLGDSATKNVGTSAGTVASGVDARFPTSFGSQTFPLNQTTVSYSANWRPVADTYIETAHAGAYVNARFTGTSAAVTYDPAPLVAASVLSADYPKLKWRIDGGGWQTAQLTSGGSSVTLATGLADSGPHTLELLVMAMQGLNDRWLRPDEVVRLTGLQVAGLLSPPSAYHQLVYWFGDSITEGVNLLGAHSPVQVADFDAQLTFPYILSNQWHVEYANFGYGGMGWTRATIGNLPGMAAYWKNLDSQHSLLLANGLFAVQPNSIVIILGTNDVSSPAAMVTSTLREMRAAAPLAKIIVVTPFGGANAATITTGFNTYKSTYFDNRAYLFDGTMSLSTTDGTHPDTAGQILAASNLNTLIGATIKAPPNPNLASPTSGAIADASSTLSGALPASAAINGDRTGRLAGASAYWSANGVASGEWLRVTFPSATYVSRIKVVSVQDAIVTVPIEPDENTACSLYCLTDFEVQYWTGAAWADVVGGNVTGNALVVRQFAFPPVSTTQIRVLAHAVGGGDPSAKLVELEAYNDHDASGAPGERVYYTPVVTPGGGSFTTLGTIVASYRLMGKDEVEVEASIPITTVGSATGEVNMTLPFAAAPSREFVLIGKDTGLSSKALTGHISASGISTAIVAADGTTPGASGARLVINGTYRIKK